ncbi:sperm acrosome membrane-associated protein 6-like [Bufo bufo]|uniref:sperm acrosome membrane-associated protein 6-like n=1 Tax=Bufo bufo TaxID=8384 RepID=UPI001ABDEDC1|nr:sperm acrosome membrane-associated protein 6-like [Bufo bufo]
MRFFTSYYLLLQIIVFLCGAQVATSCLKCFTTPADRASICYHAVSLDKMGAEECLQRLHWGFDPLNNISIAFNQIQNIRKYLKTFEKEVKKIEKLSWVEQFDKKMAEFVKGVKDRVASHPPLECRPPCGLQKAARTFSCSRCAEEDCKIPVTCPLKDIKVEELEETRIWCTASFILPDHPKVVWKYAKNIKKTDLSNFKDFYIGDDLDVHIKPTRVSHKGTYACEIIDQDDDIILRRFFYLDVTQTKSKAVEEIEAEFNRALAQKLPTQEEEEERIEHGPSTKDIILTFLQSHVSYAIYAAVCCLIVTVLVGFLWRHALSVDWSKKTSGPRTSFPPEHYLP